MPGARQPNIRRPIPHYAKSYTYFDVRSGAFDPEQPFRGRTLDYSYNTGGGNLALTARDLIAFGVSYLDDTRVSDSIKRIVRSSPFGQQAYGWWLDTDNQGRPVLHTTGASEAYQGSITIWPDHDLVVVALSNTWGINSRQGGFTLTMHKAIADIILE